MTDQATSYASRIYDHILEIFNEENDNYIDRQELSDMETFKIFFHALCTMAPNLLFNNLVSAEDQKDNLTFNQMCNSLVFENTKVEQ